MIRVEPARPIMRPPAASGIVIFPDTIVLSSKPAVKREMNWSQIKLRGESMKWTMRGWDKMNEANINYDSYNIKEDIIQIR